MMERLDVFFWVFKIWFRNELLLRRQIEVLGCQLSRVCEWRAFQKRRPALCAQCFVASLKGGFTNTTKKKETQHRATAGEYSMCVWLMTAALQ